MSEQVSAAQSIPGRPEPDGRWPLAQIQEALRGLRFGTVTVIVQDGVVVQVDRTEKRRLRGGPKPNA